MGFYLNKLFKSLWIFKHRCVVSFIMTKKDMQNLHELLQIGGNRSCADCGVGAPDWASVNIGVFICVNCSGIHRMLGVHISRIRSVRLDQWAEDTVKFMTEKGNDYVNEQLEGYLPPYYKKPTPDDPQVYREHFIRSKYDRKEFVVAEGPSANYEAVTKEGTLMKRGKSDKTFRARLFVLNTEEQTLKYFVKAELRDAPKQIIPLSQLHVCLNPEVIGHPHGIQLSFSEVGSRNFRHIYVYCEDEKECVDWYVAIRAAIYNLLASQHQEAQQGEVLSLLENHHVKQGYLYKTGPKKTEPFRKRWFSLENRTLIYFLNPLDAHPKGEIYIGNSTDGYSVEDSWGTRKEVNGGFAILLNTPDRDYLMYTQAVEDQMSWLDQIKNVLDRPMSVTEVQELVSYKEDGQRRRRSTWMKR